MPERDNPPSRLEVLRTLRAANLDVAFSTAFATLVTGAFLVGFVKYLGGGDIWIGIVTAVPAALGVMQIPGAVFARRFPSYKGFIAPGGALWRFMYVPVVLLPLLALANEIRLFILVACISIAAFSISLVNSTYNDWLAELIPSNSRGWYFSRRQAIATAVAAAVGLLGGFILDRFQAAKQPEVGYAVVYGLGVLCAALSMFFFMKMRNLERKNVARQSVREGLSTFAAPFRDKNFRRVLIFLSMFFLGQTFAGNLYAAYALESLKMPFVWFQVTAIMQATGTVASAGLWGFLSDKYGNKPCLILAGFGIALSPIGWAMTDPSNLTFSIIVLLVSHLLGGLFWCGVNLTQFNLLLSTANVEDRASYIGSGLAVQSLVSGLAPLLGAQLMAILRPEIGPEIAYKWVFISVFALRLLALFFLTPVKEEGSSMVQRTLRDLRKVTPRGVRAMRSLSRTSDAETRAAAIHSVGTHGLSLASDEIVKALGDPSPNVRRNAARALGRLGDDRLAESLIRHIQDHPDLIEEETVEALGEMRNPAAGPELSKLLRSPRSSLRRASAKALGRLGSHDAVEALRTVAAETGDPDLRRASLQALRVLGSTEASPEIADALVDPHPSVRIAAAEAVSELKLTDAAAQVRDALAYYEDEATSELVYALGSVGELSDLDTILAEAKKQRTPTARRRSLLGAACLLGLEDKVYRLMLAEGFERDTLLLEGLQTAMRANKRLRSAVDKYGSGQEVQALQTLAKAQPDKVTETFAQHQVEESFLIVALYVADR